MIGQMDNASEKLTSRFMAFNISMNFAFVTCTVNGDDEEGDDE